MLPVDAFREVQNECTATLSQHLVQLQRSISEANELHREQLNILRQLKLQPPAGKEKQSSKRVDIDKGVNKTHGKIHGTAMSPVTAVSETVASAKSHVEILEGKAAAMYQKFKAARSESSRHLDEDLPLKVSCGHHIIWGTGHSGYHKVLDYNLDKLMAYAAFPLVFSSAAIFRLRNSLPIQLVCQVIMMVAIGVVVNYLRDGQPLEDHLSFHDSSYGKSLQFINDALQRLVPFFLAFFISVNLQRWWRIRSCYVQKIHTSTMQISLLLGLVLPPSTERFRIRIERYLLASHKLIYICARQLHLTSICFEHLTAEGIMTEDEVHHVRSSTAQAPEKLQKEIGACDMSVAGIPITWASQLIYRIFNASKNGPSEVRFEFPVNLMVQLLAQCVSVKKEIQNIEMMLTSPLPFPYVHLVALVVHALAIFSCIEAGVFMGCSEVDMIHFVSHCVGVLILNGLYLGVLSIAVLLTNPFTEECVDFPASNFHCRMRKTQIFSRHVCYADESIDEEILKELEKQVLPELMRPNGKERDDDTVDCDDCDDDSVAGDNDGAMDYDFV